MNVFSGVFLIWLFFLTPFAMPCVLLFSICCYQLVSRAVFPRNILGAALARRWVECDLRKKRERLGIFALKQRRPSAHLCTQCGRCQMRGKAYGYWNSASQGCFGVVAGVQGALWESGGLLASLHISLCKLLSTGLSGVLHAKCLLCLKVEAYLKGKVKNFLLE